MFKLELKRSIGSKTFLYLIMVTILAFVMGWILPVGIDGAKNISINEYLFSTYTVFTQFGLLIFSFGTIYYINKDYNQKNIIFYSMFGTNSMKFYLCKIGVLFLEEFVSICICFGLEVIIFGYNNHVFTAMLLYILVSMYYIALSGIFSLIIKNMLMAMGASITFWIASLILVNVGGIFRSFAVFDASNVLYECVERYFLEVEGFISFSNWKVILINISVLFLICIIISFIFQKKWIRNGFN